LDAEYLFSAIPQQIIVRRGCQRLSDRFLDFPAQEDYPFLRMRLLEVVIVAAAGLVPHQVWLQVQVVAGAFAHS